MTGPTRRPAGTWTTEETWHTVVRAYTVEQLSIRTVAATIGASYSTVHKILVRAGITLRPRIGRTSPTAVARPTEGAP